MTRWCLLGLLALVVLPLSAKTMTFEKAGLDYDIPDEWKVAAGDEGETIVTAPEGGIYLENYSVEAKDFDKAVDDAFEKIQKEIKDAKITRETEKITLNNLPAVLLGGTGKVKDAQVKWLLCIVAAKQPVFFLAVVESETFDARKDDIMHIFHTVRKAE